MCAQQDNNWSIVGINTSSDNSSITITSENVQVFTLKDGYTSNSYAFSYTDDEVKYLYAASSSSNYLKSQKTLDDNGSWSIDIDESGNATIKAQGSNTKNLLQGANKSKKRLTVISFPLRCFHKKSNIFFSLLWRFRA